MKRAWRLEQGTWVRVVMPSGRADAGNSRTGRVALDVGGTDLVVSIDGDGGLVIVPIDDVSPIDAVSELGRLV